jgi:hypothetical protein
VEDNWVLVDQIELLSGLTLALFNRSNPIIHLFYRKSLESNKENWFLSTTTEPYEPTTKYNPPMGLRKSLHQLRQNKISKTTNNTLKRTTGLGKDL